MENSELIKKIAHRTPAVGRILREKNKLYETTLAQRKYIHQLEIQNSKLKKEIASRATKNNTPIWPLLKKEIINSSNAKSVVSNHKPKDPPFVINWVVPAVVASSGGQTDIFRTIKYLKERGHTCRIYIFDPTQRSNVAKQKDLIKRSFPGLGNEIYYNSEKISDCDIIFATHWLTAYPVRNFQGRGRRYYYLQGYEPHTQPAGYLGYLAESTYSFDFRGIALGEWLSEKINKEYGMECDYFNFGYEPSEYYIKDVHKPRRSILYYAQPQKAHRGFELGIMALEMFHKQNPDYIINLFGADLRNYDIPFPHKDLGILSTVELNDLYNNCAAGLALSFTNISLIPLEMIAAGCVPVVNDAHHTRLIKYADYVIYAKQDPVSVATALKKAVTTKLKVDTKRLAEKYNWDNSNAKIEEILINDLSR